jgi:hypothetical protein
MKRERMPSPAAERKVEKIANEFLNIELDDDAEAKAWLILKISAALEEAESVLRSTQEGQNMIREETLEDADAHFIGLTDAQILRELFGARGRRRAVLSEEPSEHQDGMADDEAESQAPCSSQAIVELAA